MKNTRRMQMPNEWQYKTEIKTSTIHGHGRYAMENISAGERVVVLSGPVVPKEEAPKKFPISDTHNMNCEDTYINHSEDPNLTLVEEKTTIVVEKVFVSKKKIKDGEQLTMDYRKFAGDRKFLF